MRGVLLIILISYWHYANCDEQTRYISLGFERPREDSSDGNKQVGQYSVNANSLPDKMVYPQISPLPLIQTIDQDVMSLDEFLEITGRVTNFEIHIHPKVDLKTPLKINARTHPLATISGYLERIMEVNIALYPEVRMMIVTPSPSELWRLQND